MYRREIFLIAEQIVNLCCAKGKRIRLSERSVGMDSISKPQLHKNVKYALVHRPKHFELCVVSTISNMYQKDIFFLFHSRHSARLFMWSLRFEQKGPQLNICPVSISYWLLIYVNFIYVHQAD